MINSRSKKPAIIKRYKRLIIAGLVIIFIAAIIVVVYPFFPLIGYQFSVFNERPKNDNTPIPTENTLVIPKIGVNIPIVEGKDESVLDKGAWRMPETSTPDKGSNTVITGHRWLFRPPSEKTFYLLDKLVIGDTFKIFWEGVEYNYQVVSSIIVLPTDLYVLEPTSNSVVNLITCTPLFSTKQRLIVQGELYETLNK